MKLKDFVPLKNIAAVYVISCTQNNKKYVGRTFNLFARIYTHLSNNKSTNLLYKDLQLFGIDNFEIEIVWEGNINDYGHTELDSILDKKEIEMINHYDSFKNGYNRTLGGKGRVVNPFKILYKELSQKISEIHNKSV